MHTPRFSDGGAEEARLKEFPLGVEVEKSAAELLEELREIGVDASSVVD